LNQCDIVAREGGGRKHTEIIKNEGSLEKRARGKINRKKETTRNEKKEVGGSNSVTYHIHTHTHNSVTYHIYLTLLNEGKTGGVKTMTSNLMFLKSDCG